MTLVKDEASKERTPNRVQEQVNDPGESQIGAVLAKTSQAKMKSIQHSRSNLCMD